MSRYFIHNTCPALYDKTVQRVVKQLKKDKVAHIVLEINQDEEHPQSCSGINYKGSSYGGHSRKLKACQSCEYQANGRKTSTKTTIITGGK